MKSSHITTLGGIALAVLIAVGGNVALPDEARTEAATNVMNQPLEGTALLMGVAVTAVAVMLILNVDRADRRREMHGCAFGVVQIGLGLLAALAIYVIAGGTL
jgi:hypothetical protein